MTPLRFLVRAADRIRRPRRAAVVGLCLYALLGTLFFQATHFVEHLHEPAALHDSPHHLEADEHDGQDEHRDAGHCELCVQLTSLNSAGSATASAAFFSVISFAVIAASARVFLNEPLQRYRARAPPR